MMKKILIYSLLTAGAFSMQSCFVAKQYNQPEDLITEASFRTDQLSTDSLSIAALAWKDLFTDPLLDGYIETALSNNMDIRIALENIRAAEAVLKQGKAAYFPTLGADLSYAGSSPSLHSQQGLSLDKRDYFNQFEMSASTSWEADIWGKITSNKRAANASYLQSIAAHQAVKSGLVASVASNYYQLLALDLQRDVTLETIETRKQTVETMKALKIAGRVTEAAVQQSLAQQYNAEALLVETDNRIKVLENAFSVLLGEEPHTIERTTLAQQKIDESLAYGVPVQLLSNRPDVMAAEYGLINAFELTNAARANFYPSLRLGATGGLQSMHFDNLFEANSLFANILGSLTQPIFNGRQIRTNYEVSQARQQAAYFNYKDVILNASREVSDALYSYTYNVEKIDLKQKEFTAYELAASQSEELLNFGMATYLEVLTARQSMLNTQLSLISAQFDRLNSIVMLYHALGGGWR